MSLNDRIVNRPEDLIREIEKNQELNMTLNGTGGNRMISILPKNGKIGSYVGYKYLSVNKQFKLQYSLSVALKNSLTETYALSYMTLDIF